MKNRIMKALVALMLVFALLLPEAAVLAAGENQTAFRTVTQQLARSKKKKKNTPTRPRPLAPPDGQHKHQESPK